MYRFLTIGFVAQFRRSTVQIWVENSFSCEEKYGKLLCTIHKQSGSESRIRIRN
jgi:hypothetical protein